MSGRTCKCGNSYGAQLAAKDKKKKEHEESPHRIRKPASEGTFTQSHFFHNEKQ